jgi:hypothetical protein
LSATHQTSPRFGGGFLLSRTVYSQAMQTDLRADAFARNRLSGFTPEKHLVVGAAAAPENQYVVPNKYGNALGVPPNSIPSDVVHGREQ